MRVRLRIAAVAVFVVGMGVGVKLLTIRGRVLLTRGDCPPPPGTRGGYLCYTLGHPYGTLGVVVILVTTVASVLLWLISDTYADADTDHTRLRPQASRPAC